MTADSELLLTDQTKSPTFLSVHVGMDFAGQEACFVDRGIGIVCNVQERVAATANFADALGVGTVCLVVSELRQGLLQLVAIATDKHTHTHTPRSFSGSDRQDETQQ